MGNFGKWIGGGLGWAMGGPLGALLGFLIGSAVDGAGQLMQPGSQPARQTTTGGYIMSLLVLIAAVMKADGRIMRSELDYVKEFLRRNFGEQAATEASVMLRDLLVQSIPVSDVCHQIAQNMNYSARLQMLHFLFGIAAADKVISEEERKLVEFIGRNIGISDNDLESIKAMFIRDSGYAYKILEIDPSVNDEEVKKAYRRMAMKYHPDKLTHMGEDIERASQDKFKMVNDAYQSIKKERGMV